MEMHVRRVGWVVVFAGVAMAALGLASLGAWWDLSLRLHQSDLQVDYDRLPDEALLHPLRQWSRGFSAEPFEREVEIPDLALAITVLVTLIGWAVSVVSVRHGRVVMQTALVVGVIIVALHVRDWMTFGSPGIRCGPAPLPSTRTDFADVQVLGAQLGVLSGFVFVWSMRTVTSLFVATFGAVMLAAPLFFEAQAATAVILATAAAGATWAAMFQRRLPLFAVVTSVCAGGLGAAIMVVMQHDARLVARLGAAHERNLEATMVSDRFGRREGQRDTRLTTERCELAPMAPLFSTHDGVSFMFGDHPSPVDDEQVYSQLAKIVALREESGRDPRLTINIEADSALPLADFFAVLRGFERTDTLGYVTLVFLKIDEADVWSRPSRHEHTCGLKVLISDDGLREADFPSFEALFNAATRGGLRLRVE